MDSRFILHKAVPVLYRSHLVTKLTVIALILVLLSWTPWGGHHFGVTLAQIVVLNITPLIGALQTESAVMMHVWIIKGRQLDLDRGGMRSPKTRMSYDAPSVP